MHSEPHHTHAGCDRHAQKTLIRPALLRSNSNSGATKPQPGCRAPSPGTLCHAMLCCARCAAAAVPAPGASPKAALSRAPRPRSGIHTAQQRRLPLEPSPPTPRHATARHHLLTHATQSCIHPQRVVLDRWTSSAVVSRCCPPPRLGACATHPSTALQQRASWIKRHCSPEDTACQKTLRDPPVLHRVVIQRHRGALRREEPCSLRHEERRHAQIHPHRLAPHPREPLHHLVVIHKP